MKTQKGKRYIHRSWKANDKVDWKIKAMQEAMKIIIIEWIEGC